MCQCTPEIKTPFCGKPGCEWPAPDPAAVLAKAARDAHAALDAAGKAWYAYAGMLDVGPDRTRAFAVYENIHRARRA